MTTPSDTDPTKGNSLPTSPTLTKRQLIDRALGAASAGAGHAGGAESREERTEKGVAREMLGGTLNLAGFKMRPFTLATAAMLKEIDSPLIKGVSIDSLPNVIMDVLRLLVIQTIPLEEAAEICKDPKALSLRALKLAETVPVGRTKEMVDAVMQELAASTETQVVPAPTKGGQSRKVGKR